MSDADRDAERERYLASNRSLWNSWTDLHAGSRFYDLAGFRQGGVRLDPEELAEIGPVEGMRLLHLQCHFGIDTLSWARLGARVTGVDLAPNAVELARSIAGDLGLEARFIESDVYALPDVLDETFDIVYTSRGVLGWLPDVDRWAEIVARYVRPGGRFYIAEIHPVAQALENEGVAPGEIRAAYPYWTHEAPMAFEVHGSYADPDADVGSHTEYGWNHGLGEIVTALIRAGLRIEFLNERPWNAWKLDFLVEGPPGRWRLPDGFPGQLPLSFSLLATKSR